MFWEFAESQDDPGNAMHLGPPQSCHPDNLCKEVKAAGSCLSSSSVLCSTSLGKKEERSLHASGVRQAELSTSTFQKTHALGNAYLVSGCDATHCSRAKALQTLLDWWAVKVGGLIDG